jgi:hypothetical protein
LLLSSPREVLILSGRVVFPRVEVRHVCWRVAVGGSKKMLDGLANSKCRRNTS